jgi:hypothetical protein
MGSLSIPETSLVKFVSQRNKNEVTVRIDSETVWLTVEQMAVLFGRDVSVIRRYVRHVFKQGELQPEANYRQILPVIGPGRPEPSYNLDVIISIGYRVKSAQGVEFRQWATRVLKERLIQDYKQRRAIESKGIQDVGDALRLAQGALQSQEASQSEAQAILNVIERYARSWSLLLQYDEKRLPADTANRSKKIARLTLTQARSAILRLKKILEKKDESSNLFGLERENYLEAILGNIEQTFGG